jgi:outer membrane protein assembly factor BamE (lipoprotein component of BamABCDE complex)
MPSHPGKLARKLLGAAALIAAVAGCTPSVTNHGHRLDPASLAQVTPGVTSREEVARLLGSPSTVGTFDRESWFYVSQRSEQLSFYQSDVTQQDVVRIDFDANGIVTDVHRHGLEQAQAVTPDPNKTRTLGNELTVVQQFIGNIGRFNSSPEMMGRPGPSPTGSRPGRF